MAVQAKRHDAYPHELMHCRLYGYKTSHVCCSKLILSVVKMKDFLAGLFGFYLSRSASTNLVAFATCC